MESGPEGLIGTVVRFMDDVFGMQLAAVLVQGSSWLWGTMVG